MRFEKLSNAQDSEGPTSGRRQLMMKTMTTISRQAPAMRERFPITRRAVKGWSRKLKSNQAAPLTRGLMAAFFAHFYDSGDQRISVTIADAWGALLRGNGALVLRHKDISLDGDARLSKCEPVTAEVLL